MNPNPLNSHLHHTSSGKDKEYQWPQDTDFFPPSSFQRQCASVTMPNTDLRVSVSECGFVTSTPKWWQERPLTCTGFSQHVHKTSIRMAVLVKEVCNAFLILPLAKHQEGAQNSQLKCRISVFQIKPVINSGAYIYQGQTHTKHEGHRIFSFCSISFIKQ